MFSFWLQNSLVRKRQTCMFESLQSSHLCEKNSKQNQQNPAFSFPLPVQCFFRTSMMAFPQLWFKLELWWPWMSFTHPCQVWVTWKYIKTIQKKTPPKKTDTPTSYSKKERKKKRPPPERQHLLLFLQASSCSLPTVGVRVAQVEWTHSSGTCLTVATSPTLHSDSLAPSKGSPRYSFSPGGSFKYI